MAWVAVVVGLVLVLIYPKQVLTIVFSIIVLIIVLVVWGEYAQDRRIEKFKAEKRAKEASQIAQQKERQRDLQAVEIELAYDDAVCNADYPLLVVIANNSNKTINETRWKLEAKRPGYSRNILSHKASSSNYYTDKIIQAGGRHKTCFRLPVIDEKYHASSLKWLAVSKDVVWE